jgi:hypothetical protein
MLGPLALVAWMPIFFRQRANFGVGTWVAPISWQLIGEFGGELVPASVVALSVTSIALAVAVRSKEGRGVERSSQPLLALLVMPLILLVLTLIVQPVLIARYAIVFALGLATLLALFLRRGAWPAQWTICALCVGLSTFNLWQLTSAARDETAGLHALAESIETNSKGEAVLFADGRLLFPIYYTFPNMRGRARFLDVPATDRLSGFVRAVIHNVGRQYPGPDLTSPDAAGDLSSFLVVCSPGATPPPGLFPRHDLRKINSCLYEASEPRTFHASD